jgi:O-antigen ligase
VLLFVLGVGVGTYYQRSNAFMPPCIRAIYGRENAHNYFMQTGAELGVVGLVLFLWWLGAALREHWRVAWAGGAGSVPFATCLACVGYLLTCVTDIRFGRRGLHAFWAVLAAGTAASPVLRRRPLASERAGRNPPCILAEWRSPGH